MLEHSEREDAAVACVYCDFYDHEEQTAANVIGALTKQLVNAQSIVPTEFEEAFRSSVPNGPGRW